MVIDTSVLLAILCDEPERHHYTELIASYPVRLLSAGSYLEAGIVLQARYGNRGVMSLKLFCTTAGIEVVSFDAETAEIALEAYSSYGKGSHSAGLNFGDCISYASAKRRGEPLLFKGDDFTRTDILSVTHG
ncbi:MAG: type II toxin-antitoxin system VapC family toxin [Spirochaetia bacterium]